uniref:Outer membrane efflux protein, putative n=1 Tax=Chlorobium chlorochromatii (strain CaD3) TaxID=340177 RepID=Q3ARX6_CHLCH
MKHLRTWINQRKRTFYNISSTLAFLLTPLPALTLMAVSLQVYAGENATPTRLTLEQCITIALERATPLKKADNNLTLQGTDVLQRYGSFLPRLTLSAGYTPVQQQKSYTTLSGTMPPTLLTTESDALSMQLTTSLNLFNGFGDMAALQAGLNRRDAARLSVARARETVVYDVTQAYYQALLDRELLLIARENLQASRDQLTLTERQYQAGLKSLIDREQQAAETADSQLRVMKAESRAEQSLLELLRRLQLDPLTSLELQTAADVVNGDAPYTLAADELIARAREQRNDLKSQQAQSKANRWQEREAAAQRYPSLDLNLTASTSATGDVEQRIAGIEKKYSYPPLSDQLGNATSYSVTLSMNWVLFDGFRSRYSLQSAHLNYLNQQLDVEDAKRNLAIDVRKAIAEYDAARQQISAARVSLQAASAAFNGIKRKYELGAATFVELSSARAALFNARSSLSQATYSLALQKNILDYVSGSTSFSK